MYSPDWFSSKLDSRKSNFSEDYISLFKSPNECPAKRMRLHAIPFLKGLGMLNANPCQKMSKWEIPHMAVMQLVKEHSA